MLLTDKKKAAKKKKAYPYTSVMVPWDMVADLDDYRKSIGRTRSAVVRWALREYLTRKQPKPDEVDDD